MKKVLISLIIVTLAIAFVAGSTYAVFSDTEPDATEENMGHFHYMPLGAGEGGT